MHMPDGGANSPPDLEENTMSRSLAIFSFSLLLAFSVGCGGQPAADSSADNAPAADPPAAETPAADVQPEKAPSTGGDPCSMLNVAEVASIFGAEPANIQQEAGEAARFTKGKAQDCNTTITHENVETTVTLRVQTRGENTASDAFSQQIQHLLQNGEEVGSQTYVYEPVALSGIEGALSDVHGGAFVRIRMLNWQADEEKRYRLTVSTTMTDDGDGKPPTPTPELFGQLVDAAIE
jgi:hypothetical protein